MANEEAIEILQMVKTETFYRYPKMNEALNLAISALEKQIPKKPRIKKLGYFALDYCCPCCNTVIISQFYGEWILGKKDKYCSDCGQALDWSESE